MTAYARMATLAFNKKRPLFIYKPKLHYLHHAIVELDRAVTQNTPSLNPLSYSCASAEDFIGRCSLLSRRVAAVSAQRRVLERWLAGAMAVWQSETTEPAANDRPAA